MPWEPKQPKFTIPITSPFRMETFSQVSVELWPELARHLLKAYPDIKLWAFYGELGAGKTSFIRAIGQILGFGDHISSPTFSLVNVYHTPEGMPVYHFDFYRIKSLEEVYDIGYEEYFDSGQLCLMEWPDKIAPLLARESYLAIHIDKDGDDARRVTIEKIIH